MYITITPQKLTPGFSQSCADFVAYLEKENELDQQVTGTFFNQYKDDISPQEVVKEIDSNTGKLKKIEPKFYSVTVSPSKYELYRLENSYKDLQLYTREIMKDYAASFNREINGRKITVDDIKYYAKIEHQRTFKGTDVQVRENQPYATKIQQLKTEIRKIGRGEIEGNIISLKKEIEKLEKAAPHKQNGKRIFQGMTKEGPQSHIHIIVSRKDVSNSASLSPGSKYKSSEVMMNGKMVKRGFDRDSFFEKVEKAFDRNFAYKRSFVETYQARKVFIKDPRQYFTSILGLPASEKALALKMMRAAGVAVINIPTSKVQLALKTIQNLIRGVGIAMRSGSIGI